MGSSQRIYSSPTLQEVEELLIEAIFTVSADDWKKCISHVTEKVEPRMWELDNIIEKEVEPSSSILLNLINPAIKTMN